MPAARCTVEVDVSPAALMAVIVDFSAYPTFLPEMEEATVLRYDCDVWVVRFALRVLRRLDYTLRLERRSATMLRWSLVEGAFKANNGGWDLVGLGEGVRTRAEYHVDLDVGTFVPGSLMKTLIHSSLPAMLAAFKKEAEARRLSAR